MFVATKTGILKGQYIVLENFDNSNTYKVVIQSQKLN